MILIGAAVITAAVAWCLKGAAIGAVFDVVIQYGKCLLKNCRIRQLPFPPPPLGIPWPNGPLPWDPRCKYNVCDVAASGVLGCAFNFLWPGLGPIAVVGVSKVLLQQIVRKLVIKMLSKFIAKKALVQLCP